MLYDIRHQINKLYRSFIMIFIEYRSQKKKIRHTPDLQYSETYQNKTGIYILDNPPNSSLGFTLANCIYCPLTNSICVIITHSTSNSRQVSRKTGYKCSSCPWSIVGNRWCRAWSPKLVKTKKWEPVISFLSRTAFIWKIPQSSSFFGLKYSKFRYNKIF